MAKFLQQVLLLLALSISSNLNAAQVIPITPVATCFTCSSEISQTMFWQGKNPKALILFIPGGDGFIGLKPNDQDNKRAFVQTLKRITDPSQTSGRLDLVLLDSPSPLSPNQRYPADRTAKDHMIRIESAILFYKQKTGLPVWLLGHSNGGISLSEFVQYAQKNNKLNLISGVIASGVRNESDFDPPINFPMLFIHNKNDGCNNTSPETAYKTYQHVKKFNQSTTEYISVESGQSQSGNPCTSGFHMNFGADDEYANDIEKFILQFYKST